MALRAPVLVAPPEHYPSHTLKKQDQCATSAVYAQ